MRLVAPNTVQYQEESNVKEGLSATARPVHSPFTLSLIPPDIGLTPQSGGTSSYAPLYDAALDALYAPKPVTVPAPSQRIPARPDVVQQGGQAHTSAQASQVTPLQTVDGVMDLIEQWQAMVDTEPLTWLINPQSLGINYTKLAQFSEATRQGFVYQAWGDEEVRLSITGTIGGFYSAERGLHWLSRHDSVAWQHFSHILERFRNGAAIYDRSGRSRSLRAVGWQRIDYDGTAWIGHMESFDYSIEHDKPHGGWQFTMEFVASRQLGTDNNPTSIQPYAESPNNSNPSSNPSVSVPQSPAPSANPGAFRKVH